MYQHAHFKLDLPLAASTDILCREIRIYICTLRDTFTDHLIICVAVHTIRYIPVLVHIILYMLRLMADTGISHSCKNRMRKVTM